MQGAFDDGDFESVQRRRDAELTLGSGTLLAIFFGLVLLCALIFGLGYAVGHHAALQPPASSPQSASTAQTAPPANARPKPSATPQAGSASSARPPASGQPQVRPALPAANPSQPVSQYPPSGYAGGLMVQVAAVSHAEDADVLVNALRRRGYAVTAHREPADNLIHVRIGPFNNRNDANLWRQKLLNDGYNAILQP
jgi:cell division septation protein DedD